MGEARGSEGGISGHCRTIASTESKNGSRVNCSLAVYSPFYLVALDEKERTGLEHTIATLDGITTMISRS